MPVHRVAARGFGSSAAAYERGRPGYPPEAVDWLVQRLHLGPGRTVVDVAAGTGKLSRALAAAGPEVVAVEPVAAMRALIGPGVRALDGTADELPLPNASADAITVAQAFHWFAGEAALAEFHRVLRPGGGLALIWNRRLLDDPTQVALEEIFAPHRSQVPSHDTRQWRAALDRTARFEPLEEQAFPNQQVLDAGELADRVASTSFIAALPDAARTAVVEQARALAAGGPVTLPYRTEVYVSRRR